MNRKRPVAAAFRSQLVNAQPPNVFVPACARAARSAELCSGNAFRDYPLPLHEFHKLGRSMPTRPKPPQPEKAPRPPTGVPPEVPPSMPPGRQPGMPAPQSPDKPAPKPAVL